MLSKILSRARKAISKEKILYYPGCMTRFHLKQQMNNYKSILSDLNIGFEMTDEIVCCGSPLLNAGYLEDFEAVKRKNLNLLRKHRITKIITNCPHCLAVFKNKYGFEAEHILKTLHDHKHKLSSQTVSSISYHDPCLLSRKNDLSKQAREVLKKSGFSVDEPRFTKENTFCCGAGGGLKQNSPEIANKIAKERLSQLRNPKIVVSCPYCYAHFKDNLSPDSGKEVLEVSDILFEG